jgi:hypothetical protein
VAYALPLTSFDSDGIPFRIIYFLILEGVELAETETLTMKRMVLALRAPAMSGREDFCERR